MREFKRCSPGGMRSTQLSLGDVWELETQRSVGRERFGFGPDQRRDHEYVYEDADLARTVLRRSVLD
jgi:hypothetical protein